MEELAAPNQDCNDLLHHCNAVVGRNVGNFKQDDVLAETRHNVARLFTFLVLVSYGHSQDVEGGPLFMS